MMNTVRVAGAALLLQLGLISGAQAMDGIKGTGIAVRALPADIVSISIHIAEPIGEQAPDAGATDEAKILKGLESAGLKVLDASKLFQSLSGVERSGYFSSGKGASKGSDSFQSQMTIRVTGFKQFIDVLQVLEKSGAQRFSVVLLSSSKAEGIRDELEKEAIEKAVQQAQKRAEAAGVKLRGVGDLTVTPARAPGTEGALAPTYGYTAPGVSPMDDFTPGQNLFKPQQAGELPVVKYAVSASVVMAVKAD
jgi:uncharacterized protein YggE